MQDRLGTMAYNILLPFEKKALNNWICETYGIVGANLTIRAGYMSTVVFVQCGDVRYVLKCVPRLLGNNIDVSPQILFTDHLASAELPVGTCLPGRSGQRVFEVGDYVLTLWSFLEGTVFQAGNLAQLRVSGSTLAQLHLVGQQWSGRNSLPHTGWARMVADVEHQWHVLAQRGDQAQSLVEDMHDCLARLPTPDEGEPLSVIHNDFRAQNVLFQGQTVSGLLDFDNICLAPRIFDLMYGMVFFQAVIEDSPLQESEMLELFKGYHHVYPLAEDVLACTPSWMGIALLKGVTLWGRICYGEQANLNAQHWIQAYKPLFGRIGEICDFLLTGMQG